MMHKKVEVYMDDMIAKSKTSNQHVEDLRKLFERLQKYRLGLNPAKCTYGVKTRKLLGFIVNQKRIEVDPDKVKVIQNMPPPKTETEVRGFLGRVNYIARINGRSAGATRRLREERTGHILPQQEIHGLQTKIPNTRANMMRSSLGSKKAEAIHAGPHHMIARWQMALSEYDTVYTSQKAIKGSTLAE
ncbi:Retrovirus-related Pol polyprotein from transposon 17.6, partial [Mucuna pruriens]